MHKVILIFLVVVLAAAYLAVPALAARQSPPLGTCPPGFELHHLMDHTDHHNHHIGLAEDLNQDGHICVQRLSNGLHVHVDNVLPY
jgi:hypothetical protein